MCFFHQKYRFCEIVVYRMIQQNSVTTGCANCMTSSSDIETVSTSPNSRRWDSNGSCLIGDSSIELARLVSDAEWKLEMDVSSARIELRLLLVLELMLLLLVLIELWMPWRFRRCFVRSPGEKKNKIKICVCRCRTFKSQGRDSQSSTITVFHWVSANQRLRLLTLANLNLQFYIHNNFWPIMDWIPDRCPWLE